MTRTDFGLDFYRGKRVLVTGHTGFKGTWLCAILLQAGAQVTGYALEPPTDPSVFALTDMEKRINSVIGDIRDLARLRQTFEECRPEIVIHMAAQPIVRESYKDPVYTYETNVMGTVHVLECVRTCESVRSFINVTTDKVYLNREWAWGYRENEELNGYDPYSNSKSCSELVTSSYKNSFFGIRAAYGDLNGACGQCDRRRRLCGGPNRAGLCARGAFRAGNHCAKPRFHQTLSACSGASYGISSYGEKAV